jgi:hypothetical protein
MTAAGSPIPWLVSTQLSGKVCAVPEYGEPIADDDALAMEGPDALERPDI